MTTNTELRWHELKTDPDVFDAVAAGRKTFEIRLNDRDFQEGDGLLLRRTRDTGWAMKNTGAPLEYTGEELRCIVTHVLRGPVYGLADGWVVMSIALSAVSRSEVGEPAPVGEPVAIREALENLVRQHDGHPRALDKLRRQGLSPDHPTVTATLKGHGVMMERAWQQAREAIERTPCPSASPLPQEGKALTAELPDEGELEEWRSAADALLSHKHPAQYELRRAAMLLQNAYTFARAIEREIRGPLSPTSPPNGKTADGVPTSEVPSKGGADGR